MFEVSEGIRMKNDENGYDFRICYTRFPFATPLYLGASIAVSETFSLKSLQKSSQIQ